MGTGPVCVCVCATVVLPFSRFNRNNCSLFLGPKLVQGVQFGRSLLCMCAGMVLGVHVTDGA